MTNASSPSPEPSEQAQILQKLSEIESRLTGLEKSVSATHEMMATVPSTVATVVDTVDGTVDELSSRGINVDVRLRRIKQLLEKASDPSLLESLERSLEVATSLPHTFAAAADTFDAHVSKLAESGVDIDARLRILLQVIERISAPESLTVVCDLLENVDAIRRLLDSGVFGPGAISVVGRLAHALGKVDIENATPVGLFGALSALNKADTKRALGVLVAIGRSFGASFDKPLPITIHSRPIPPGPARSTATTSKGNKS